MEDKESHKYVNISSIRCTNLTFFFFLFKEGTDYDSPIVHNKSEDYDQIEGLIRSLLKTVKIVFWILIPRQVGNAKVTNERLI